jgi:hypothetical protein
MGAVKRVLEDVIELLAWELADHSEAGPVEAVCWEFEKRLWDVQDRRPGAFDRLCVRYGVPNPFAI